MILDAMTIALVLLGGTFALIAGIGIVRMPDLYTRMQSATKAGTLGVACIALAVATHFRATPVLVEAILVITFFFATAPIASHLIARASHHAGVPLWRQTVRDDLSEQRKSGDRRKSNPDDPGAGSGKPVPGNRSAMPDQPA